ncbi:MAG: hypothetical protein HY905_17655 [Deltaproteobacteria bacterium]|nr:hypothetical protein [Deltaproteobacteria bacterium]
MGRKTITITSAAVLFAVGLTASHAAAQTIPAAPPGSEAATGFLLQGTLSARTPLTGLGEMSLVYGSPLSGDVRIGWMMDSVAVALKASFAGISDGGSDVTGTVKFGPLAEIFLWRSADRRARVYALLGAEFGALLVGGEGDDLVSGFDLGFGGCYFLHRNFTVGLELGSHTDVYGHEDPLFISSFFASLVLGFVVGD